MPKKYRVSSSKGKGKFYFVTDDGVYLRCSCADYQFRKKRCKHILAVLDHIVENQPGHDEAREDALAEAEGRNLPFD